MSELMPHVLRHTVALKSVLAASQSFGIVALTLLVALMIEGEALRVAGSRRARQVAFSACSAVLLVTVALTIAARLGSIIP
jgi:hypothetical protein